MYPAKFRSTSEFLITRICTILVNVIFWSSTSTTAHLYECLMTELRITKYSAFMNDLLVSFTMTNIHPFDNAMSLLRHEQVCLSGLPFERYFSRYREKYLSKRSLLKHTCSWRDKLIVLWILNRQEKIFLCTPFWYLLDRDRSVSFHTRILASQMFNDSKDIAKKVLGNILVWITRANYSLFYQSR